jgi:hypothetical protein
MCFARISEDRANISQYIINPSVFITEAEMVYCAVRPEYLNADHVILIPVGVGVNKLRMFCTTSRSTSGLVTF